MGRICVVDDNEMLRESVAETLTRDDHLVSTFADPTEALRAIKDGTFECVITDLKMPGMDGVSLLRELRSAGCEASVILMTAFGSVESAVQAMKLGAFDYIQKPFDADQLCMVVDRAIQNAVLRSENEALKRSLTDGDERVMVGESSSIRVLRDTAGRVAPSGNTVLIQGESGTGKELLARAIHRSSPRADRPMLCLNCAALSANLLESELFGHERGAFTGADRVRKGRFELADGGTLLLDEVSEIPMPLQAKLLRVLQERQFERVGSSVTRSIDVRVIATTNRNLIDWVARKRFREDLYFRLSVLPVVVPPLRERREDVPLLVDHFLGRAASRAGRPKLRVDDRAMSLLVNYDWPGNVRELENLCERASVLVLDGLLTVQLVSPWLSGIRRVETLDQQFRPGHLLEDMERQMIEKTLKECGGHRAKTAATLGIGVRTLGLKLKQWREAQAREQAAGYKLTG
ncbi:MAG TPA: sigma-54 dependent transcriptional regulator [Phycisphaerae bacterium]|nr:sigma-54 dependent transcriptional regulator [Phycisphaerae bacterium]HRY69772.1 sigma-54 dependent transcriptional regulator [Phycisphaerae bacterium]HSA29248.1 sigma-54 dependent transcriptional regulator [Phycisphaerae bacterium]